MNDVIDETTAGAIVAALKEIQRTVNSQQTLMTQLFRNSERIERRVDGLDRRLGDLDRRIDETNVRITELKDEFALILKAELSGWSANFEDRLDNKLPDLVADAVREALKERS